MREDPTVPFRVHSPSTDPLSAPVVVDAEQHCVEGRWRVFRRTTTVMGRPRLVVALRLPIEEGQVVEPWPVEPG